MNKIIMDIFIKKILFENEKEDAKITDLKKQIKSKNKIKINKIYNDTKNY